MTLRPRVLCVDDEPYVLDGLNRQLRTVATVTTTVSPAEAVRLLREVTEPFTVMVSDMRMPEMTGTRLLMQAREVAPDTVRVLLTGDSDINSAIDAINQGCIFRFLAKPCSPDALRATIVAAHEQHRLVTAERELLQATVKGCIEALMDTLAMAQPAVFSRAARLRRLAADVSRCLGMADSWQVEVAAQLGEIGAITLPPGAVRALESGRPGLHEEAHMLTTLPKIADDLLSRIPRLEPVRELVRLQQPTDRTQPKPLNDDAPLGARVLQAVREYDALVWRGMPAQVALAAMVTRKTHRTEVLRALKSVAEPEVSTRAVTERKVEDLRAGHQLAADLFSANGQLLVGRGHVLTDRLLIRIRNYAVTSGLEGSPVVFVQGAGPSVVTAP